MTTYASKSSAVRAAKKAVDEETTYELFQAEDGRWGFHLFHQDEPELAEQTDDGPVAAEGSEEADEATLQEMLDLAEQDDEQLAWDMAFVREFAAMGGNAPRAKCRTLRALAGIWTGSRATFVDAAVAYGIEPGTAKANWQAGKA